MVFFFIFLVNACATQGGLTDVEGIQSLFSETSSAISLQHTELARQVWTLLDNNKPTGALAAVDASRRARFTWLSWSRLWPSGCTDHLRHGRTAAPNTVRPTGSTYNTNNSGGRAADDRSIVTILREYGSALRRRTTRRLCATHVRNASGTGSGSAGGRTIFFYSPQFLSTNFM